MLLILQLTRKARVICCVLFCFFLQMSLFSTSVFNGAAKGSGRLVAGEKRLKPSHFSFIYSECMWQKETKKWSHPNPAVPPTVVTPAEVHILQIFNVPSRLKAFCVSRKNSGLEWSYYRSERVWAVCTCWSPGQILPLGSKPASVSVG